MKSHHRWMGLALVLAVIGCDDATGPAPDDDFDAGITGFGSEDGFRGRRMGGPFGRGLPGLRLPPLDGELPDCPDDAPRCPEGGADFERDVTFLDAAGGIQDSFDAATTASVHFVVSGTATHEGPRGGSVEVERSRDLWATGLLDGDGSPSGTATWSGRDDHRSAGTHEVDGSTVTVSREWRTTVNDVVVPNPREAGNMPLSGSVTTVTALRLVGAPNGDRDEEHTITVTFNGTSVVAVEVDGEVRTVDLEELRRRRQDRQRGAPGAGSRGWRGGR